MKNAQRLVLYGLFLLLLSSSGFKTKTSFTLEEALKANLVKANITGLGGHSGESIEVSLSNISASGITVNVNHGTLFNPADDEEQNLLVPKTETVSLARNETKNIPVHGYCTEPNDMSPDENSTFTVNRMDDSKLDSLYDFLHKHPSLLNNENIIQSAVWALASNQSASSIYDQNNKEVEELRSLVCRLKGVKKVWYNTPSQITVTEDRRVIAEPTEVNGEIEFTIEEKAELKGFVIDDHNEVKYANPNTINIPSGKIGFWFTLKVKGWDEGQYYVVYTNKGDTLLKQGFNL